MKLSYLVVTLLFTIQLIFLFSVVKDRAESPNDLSFMAGVVSWERFNRPNIDGTPQISTRDKAFYNGKFYSSKPQFLLFAMGKSINIVFNLGKRELLQNDIPIYKTATYLTSTIPIVLICIILFILFNTNYKIGIYKSLLLSTIFPIATLFLAYSQYLNTHTLTALFTFLILVLIVNPKPFQRRGILLYSLLLGFFLSALLVCEPSFFLLSCLSLIFPLYKLFRKSYRPYLYIFFGFIPLALLHFYFNYLSFGVLYPPQMNMARYFGYPGSHLYNITNPLDINVYRPHFIILLFNNLLGTHGLFLYMPVLLFFFLHKKKTGLGWIFTLSVLIISIVAYSVTSPNFGGWSYGNRRLIPLIPLLFYYAVLAVSKTKSKLLKILFIVLIFVSIFFSYLGFKNTWFNKKIHITRDFSYFPLLYNLNKDYFKIFSYDP